MIKIKKNSGMTRSMFTQGHPEYSRGMTYVELIVVLVIWGIMSSIIIFNYREFQARVDVKNLASDIAQKIVEAQKSAVNGDLSPHPPTTADPWKPSYGLYFDISPEDNKKSFVYFADLNNSSLIVQNNPGFYNPPTSDCPSGECLDKISITTGSYISSLNVFYTDSPPTLMKSQDARNLTISFTRPNSGANFQHRVLSGNSTPAYGSFYHYVEIKIQSSKSASATATITVNASGKVEVN